MNLDYIGTEGQRTMIIISKTITLQLTAVKYDLVTYIPQI